MKKYCFFGMLFFLCAIFLTAQEKIVIECEYSHFESKGHYTAEIMFDNHGIIKSYTGDGFIINVVKDQNIYTVTNTLTNSEHERWRAREIKHFIEENNGVITVKSGTALQPVSAIITDTTIILGTRINFSMNNNTINFGRYVLSYEDGRLTGIEDPDEFQLFDVTRQNSRQYTFDILAPGAGSDIFRIWANTTPKTMRQNAINFFILLTHWLVEYIPFIIGRY